MKSLIFVPVFILLVSCASTNPKDYELELVEGSRIGKVEVLERESENKGHLSDSAKFDDQYLRKDLKVTFKYPGRSINLMKIFYKNKLIKECDESGVYQ